MYLVEPAGIAATALPLDALRGHLRLGRGFSDDAAQDPLLERCLRSAIAEIERRSGIAVIERKFVWTVHAWRHAGRECLPRGPLVSVDVVRIHDIQGDVREYDANAFHVVRDGFRASIAAQGFALPGIPIGGRAEIAFAAGWPHFDAVPADLAHAVLALASEAYNDRGGAGRMPPRVQDILRQYRPMRLWGGRN